eukprot:sb/3476726/
MCPSLFPHAVSKISRSRDLAGSWIPYTAPRSSRGEQAEIPHESCNWAGNESLLYLYTSLEVLGPLFGFEVRVRVMVRVRFWVLDIESGLVDLAPKCTRGLHRADSKLFSKSNCR